MGKRAILERKVPAEYSRFVSNRQRSVLVEGDPGRLGWRGFGVGSVLSFFLAVGAPYGNMVIRGSYMAMDFSTPGAIFLFLLLIGLLNVLFKLIGRRRDVAAGLAIVAIFLWSSSYPALEDLDPLSPGCIFSSFIVLALLINIPIVCRGNSLALNRAELILVYVMLLIVSALCTMGLSEQILPAITAVFYFASPQNEWIEKLLPHLAARPVLVRDGAQNAAFYEGLGSAGGKIPYDSWIEPLAWWGVFLLALYVVMISVAVILRRQWMERERISYPITQIGVAMIRGEREDRLLNGFFSQPSMWLGCALPLIFGSSLGLNRYFPAFPVLGLTWFVPFAGSQTLQLTISWAMLGFSYLINANIAAGIWVFHLIAKLEKEVCSLAGLTSSQKITFGVSDYALLGYQGVGALIAMVVVGLWVGREHLANVLRKAVGRGSSVRDDDEIISYRTAVIGTLLGTAAMCIWLWIMGTPWWVAMVFIIVALLIFIGVTRIVAEGGLAALRAPMIAPDLVVQGLGASLVGPVGIANLSLAFIWSSDIRVFLMATCANALKLIEEMDGYARRRVFWGIVIAVFIGTMGSVWMIFHMAYEHGGINLSSWFFKGAPAAAYNSAVRTMAQPDVYWPGWGFFAGGGLLMTLMMWARQRLPWWPVHPIGFPIGANMMMNHVWFSVFLAWALKRLVLRFGGAGGYRQSQSFFLGMIAGQMLCNGMWLVIDYFTGKVGNSIFWV